MAIDTVPDRSPSLRPGHAVEEQRIDVKVAREDRAFAVMERIGELNRARLLPLIERIFDEFDRPGEVIRIDRLDLDLGRFGEGELGDIETRLAASLREALRKAIPPPSRLDGALQGVGEAASVRSVGHALLEYFEHWLSHGTWPYGAGLGTGTAPADLLERLIENEPEALAAMLRRSGASDTVPRRLVRQLPEALLARLLERLEPASAHWVLDYMAETRAAHVAEPLVEETPEEFGRGLWLIVLRDALRQAGLRSNRRAFVGKLVSDIAAAAGVSAADLLAQLKAALATVPSAGMGEGSLLSILAEIEPEASAPDFGELARRLSGQGAVPVETADLLERARLSHPEETGWLLRRLIREGSAALLLRRLGGTVSAPALLSALVGDAEAAAWKERLAGARDEAGLAALFEEGATSSPGLVHAPVGDAEAAGWKERLAGAQDEAGLAALLDEAAASASAEGGGGTARIPDLRRAWPGKAEAGRRHARREEGLEAGRGAADSLARIAALLGDSAAGDPEVLHGAVLAARASDPVGLRRLLRRFAVADAGRLLGRLAPAIAAEAVPQLLLPPHLAAPASALIRAAGCSPEESAELLARAAALPPTAPAILLISRLAETLAGRRGRPGADMLRELHAGAIQAGGEARRTLAPHLEQALRPAAEAGLALARRFRAIDWLLDILHRQRGGGFGHARGRTLLASLAGTAPEKLRHELQGSGLEGKGAAKALARLDPASLRRLIALLAPSGGEGRKALRGRLLGARDAAELAAIAAELLVSGRVSAAGVEGRSGPQPASSLAAAEEEALALAALRSGAAPRTKAERRSLALLVRRRPFDLLRLLAERSGPAERELLGDPLLTRLLFARLPEAQRLESEALARLLTWPAARAGLRPETLLRSLAAAALAAMRGRGTDFAAHWRSALLAASSPAERRLLSRLLPPAPPAPAPPPEPEPGSPAWLLAALRMPARERTRLLRAALRSDAFRRRFARRLPRHLLVRLIAALAPFESQALLAAGAELSEALRSGGGSLTEEALWEAKLAAALAPEGGAVALLLDRLLPVARGEPRLPAATGPLAAAIEERRSARSKPKPPPPQKVRRPPPEDGGDGASIAVFNSGLVLTAVYLPRLFAMLELVAPDAEGKLAWRGPEHSGRAVHILQYLVDGRCDAPEPLLVLNKLLCGLDPSWPVLAEIAMSEEERTLCASLLGAVVENWPILSCSSVAALQETFLQREGRIRRVEGGWKLDVERKVLDVLVDSVPWSFSVIRNDWMEETLFVSW